MSLLRTHAKERLYKAVSLFTTMALVVSLIPLSVLTVSAQVPPPPTPTVYGAVHYDDPEAPPNAVYIQANSPFVQDVVDNPNTYISIAGNTVAMALYADEDPGAQHELLLVFASEITGGVDTLEFTNTPFDGTVETFTGSVPLDLLTDYNLEVDSYEGFVNPLDDTQFIFEFEGGDVNANTSGAVVFAIANFDELIYADLGGIPVTASGSTVTLDVGMSLPPAGLKFCIFGLLDTLGTPLILQCQGELEGGGGGSDNLYIQEFSSDTLNVYHDVTGFGDGADLYMVPTNVSEGDSVVDMSGTTVELNDSSMDLGDVTVVWNAVVNGLQISHDGDQVEEAEGSGQLTFDLSGPIGNVSIADQVQWIVYLATDELDPKGSGVNNAESRDIYYGSPSEIGVSEVELIEFTETTMIVDVTIASALIDANSGYLRFDIRDNENVTFQPNGWTLSSVTHSGVGGSDSFILEPEDDGAMFSYTGADLTPQTIRFEFTFDEVQNLESGDNFGMYVVMFDDIVNQIGSHAYPNDNGFPYYEGGISWSEPTPPLDIGTDEFAQHIQFNEDELWAAGSKIKMVFTASEGGSPLDMSGVSLASIDYSDPWGDPSFPLSATIGDFSLTVEGASNEIVVVTRDNVTEDLTGEHVKINLNNLPNPFGVAECAYTTVQVSMEDSEGGARGSVLDPGEARVKDDNGQCDFGLDDFKGIHETVYTDSSEMAISVNLFDAYETGGQDHDTIQLTFTDELDDPVDMTGITLGNVFASDAGELDDERNPGDFDVVVSGAGNNVVSVTTNDVEIIWTDVLFDFDDLPDPFGVDDCDYLNVSAQMKHTSGSDRGFAAETTIQVMENAESVCVDPDIVENVLTGEGETQITENELLVYFDILAGERVLPTQSLAFVVMDSGLNPIVPVSVVANEDESDDFGCELDVTLQIDGRIQVSCDQLIDDSSNPRVIGLDIDFDGEVTSGSNYTILAMAQDDEDNVIGNPVTSASITAGDPDTLFIEAPSLDDSCTDLSSAINPQVLFTSPQHNSPTAMGSTYSVFINECVNITEDDIKMFDSNGEEVIGATYHRVADFDENIAEIAFEPQENLDAFSPYYLYIVSGNVTSKDTSAAFPHNYNVGGVGNVMKFDFFTGNDAFDFAGSDHAHGMNLVASAPTFNGNAGTNSTFFFMMSDFVDTDSVDGNVTVVNTATEQAVAATIEVPQVAQNVIVVSPDTVWPSNAALDVRFHCDLENEFGVPMCGDDATAAFVRINTQGLDSTAPTITSYSPASGTTYDITRHGLNIKFSEMVNPESLFGGIQCQLDSAEIPCEVEPNPFDKSAHVSFPGLSIDDVGGDLELLISSDITDLAGNAIVGVAVSYVISNNNDNDTYIRESRANQFEFCYMPNQPLNLSSSDLNGSAKNKLYYTITDADTSDPISLDQAFIESKGGEVCIRNIDLHQVSNVQVVLSDSISTKYNSNTIDAGFRTLVVPVDNDFGGERQFGLDPSDSENEVVASVTPRNTGQYSALQVRFKTEDDITDGDRIEILVEDGFGIWMSAPFPSYPSNSNFNLYNGGTVVTFSDVDTGAGTGGFANGGSDEDGVIVNETLNKIVVNLDVEDGPLPAGSVLDFALQVFNTEDARSMSEGGYRFGIKHTSASGQVYKTYEPNAFPIVESGEAELEVIVDVNGGSFDGLEQLLIIMEGAEGTRIEAGDVDELGGTMDVSGLIPGHYRIKFKSYGIDGSALYLKDDIGDRFVPGREFDVYIQDGENVMNVSLEDRGAGNANLVPVEFTASGLDFGEFEEGESYIVTASSHKGFVTAEFDEPVGDTVSGTIYLEKGAEWALRVEPGSSRDYLVGNEDNIAEYVSIMEPAQSFVHIDQGGVCRENYGTPNDCHIEGVVQMATETVGGVVISDEEVPSAGARVCIGDPETQTGKCTPVKGDGSYSMKLAQGQYSAIAMKDGITARGKRLKVNNGSFKVNGAVAPSLDFLLTTQDTVSYGFVIANEDGSTVSNSALHCFSANPPFYVDKFTSTGTGSVRLPEGISVTCEAFDDQGYITSKYFSSGTVNTVNNTYTKAAQSSLTGTIDIPGDDDVQISARGDNGWDFDVADSDGSYRLNLPDGTYQVVVRSNNGVKFEPETVVVSGDTVHDITVAGSENEVDIVFDGAPIRGFFRLEGFGHGFEAKMNDTNSTTITVFENGTYRFIHNTGRLISDISTAGDVSCEGDICIINGEGTITLTPGEGTEVEVSVTDPEGDPIDFGFIEFRDFENGVFSNAEIENGSATVDVPVTDNVEYEIHTMEYPPYTGDISDVSGGTLEVQLEDGNSISGLVTIDGNIPSSDVWVWAEATDNSAFGHGKVDELGGYEIQVQTGKSYTVYVGAPTYEPTAFGVPITVNGNVAGVDIDLTDDDKDPFAVAPAGFAMNGSEGGGREIEGFVQVAFDPGAAGTGSVTGSIAKVTPPSTANDSVFKAADVDLLDQNGTSITSLSANVEVVFEISGDELSDYFESVDDLEHVEGKWFDETNLTWQTTTAVPTFYEVATGDPIQDLTGYELNEINMEVKIVEDHLTIFGIGGGSGSGGGDEGGGDEGGGPSSSAGGNNSKKLRADNEELRGSAEGEPVDIADIDLPEFDLAFVMTQRHPKFLSKDVNTSNLRFPDIDGHWGVKYIQALADVGVLQGVDGYAQPDRSMTRAELVKIALEVNGYRLSDTGLYRLELFSDIDESHWSAQYVARALELGIVKGYADGTFRPNAPVNKAEALKVLMLAAAKDVDQYSAESVFEDVSKDQWFAQFVNAGKVLGVITGSDGKFEPMKEVTRAEAAAMAYRAGAAAAIAFSTN